MIPKVSVIVPVYNTAQYLTKCLDSLVNQTLQEIEIFVVNDGSTDASQAIIDDFAARYPEKFKVHIQENQGQAVARNYALAHITGEFVGFLDSDDFAKPTLFEKLYHVAIAEGADFVECDYDYIDYETKAPLKKYAEITPKKNQNEMFLDPLVSPWNKLYKRTVLQGQGKEKLFTEGCIYEDTAFYLKLIPSITHFAIVQEPLVIHYQHISSTTNGTQPKRIADMITVLQDTYDFYASRSEAIDYKAELEYFAAKILLCSSFRRLTYIADKPIRTQMLNDTWSFLLTNCPNFKKNPYLKTNKRGLFMKSFNSITIHLWCVIFRVLSKHLSISKP